MVKKGFSILLIYFLFFCLNPQSGQAVFKDLCEKIIKFGPVSSRFLYKETNFRKNLIVLEEIKEEALRINESRMDDSVKINFKKFEESFWQESGRQEAKRLESIRNFNLWAYNLGVGMGMAVLIDETYIFKNN